ncbi:hypothetical protein COW36_23490 [bacterium (Candidatus Blackallbacteria) CG17_big_fil_post_rev_8_21_14_2_50_48_46]|uniref:Zinc-regulated TonB-dependent outer membrane receptor n=1 Tax=bacterium (Candidatus Blackallbacteria) CG17_big_fil_post_rev_8_21_14_2_50_48_46 TaxID=2014261 RepID=A0A2M7FXX5_9BACT|nr:MAG: hypothetical protein COW64_17700 [bacterium (Candidatus Blackallbacteria) CG18_big_fil_WC_8_21_14_2_50_49_26]PIW14006.1 MAG: hypothetical protein COW36_23490 [bacterium (Candidatus Blackallbacteria) CG17_big_fil_post_rev_8_21_14_2_50_48_46]PIW46857.1 MAG: hypothetical protein COW20_14665 [bacterium (Candidatus Blackallbacteria) CG13_big_fil_rev_8_21_14_2_50_49_14]
MSFKLQPFSKTVLVLASFFCLISPVAAETENSEAETQSAQDSDSTLIDQPSEEEPSEEESGFENPAPETDLNTLQSQSLLSSPFNQQIFVPNISLILDSSAGGRSLSNQDASGLVSPFSLQGLPSEHGMGSQNGLNFNYAELSLQAPIDPFFDAFASFHLQPEGFEIEEAYFSTRGLPGNFQLKGGKFLSHFGRLNNQHEHFWNFAKRPLVYDGLFGSEGLNEMGLQVNWVAPLDFFLNLGIEALQGNNSESFGTSEVHLGQTQIAENNLPNLLVAYAKGSVDLGEQFVVLGGLSLAQGGARQAAVESSNPSALGNFAGGARVYGADLTLRWFQDSYREVLWQTEFLHRSLDGQQEQGGQAYTLRKEQSGLYSELVWRFAWQWRAGARLDLITQNQTWQNQSLTAGPTLLPRYAAMLEFHPSEFSRLRLEYNLDQSRLAAGVATPVHELFLQLNLSMGAHGAHNF